MQESVSNEELRQSLERARKAAGTELDYFLHHHAPEVQTALLENPNLGEQHLLVLLSRKDLSRESVTAIAASRAWMSVYAIKFAVAGHPRTPVHVGRSLLKSINLFDLLRLLHLTGVPAQLKRIAEDAILSQKGALALGQRTSLARRGSSRLAAGFLDDTSFPVIEAALSNSSLTEQLVASALLTKKTPRSLAEAVTNNQRWSARHPIKVALARSPYVSLGRLMEYLSEFSMSELRELSSDHRVAGNIRVYAWRMVQRRVDLSKQRTQ